MVDAVTGSVPYSYYNVLNPPKPPVNNGGTTSTPTGTTGNTTGTTTSADSGSATSLSPQILAFLQTFGPGSDAASQTSSLLGSRQGGIYDALGSSLQKNILGSAYKTALDAAKQGAAAQAKKQARPDTLQNIINNYRAASNAYNNVLRQQAQAVIDATPIVI